MVYELLLGIGVIGTVLMAIMGTARVGGHHAGSSGGHGAAGHVHAQGHIGAHQSHGHHGIHGRTAMEEEPALAHTHGTALAGAHVKHFNFMVFLPSPLDIFAMCFGAGAAGMLAEGHVAPSFMTLLAVIGAIVFDFGVVRPAMAGMAQFASKPSAGLEGTIALEAEAISNFDHEGLGLVCIKMEGQLVQLLAKLAPEELSAGTTVHKGEQVVVTEVDAKRGTCLVTRQLSL